MHQPSSYKRAVERIKVLSTSIKVTASTSSSQTWGYSPLKPFKLAHPMRHINYELKKSKEGKQIKISATNLEQKSVSFLEFAQEIPANKKPLRPERFKRWRFEEQQLAKRKLQGIQKEASGKKRQITLMDEAQSAQEESDQNALWQDMIKLKEERQFQITRITKYFAN